MKLTLVSPAWCQFLHISESSQRQRGADVDGKFRLDWKWTRHSFDCQGHCGWTWGRCQWLLLLWLINAVTQEKSLLRNKLNIFYNGRKKRLQRFHISETASNNQSLKDWREFLWVYSVWMSECCLDFHLLTSEWTKLLIFFQSVILRNNLGLWFSTPS